MKYKALICDVDGTLMLNKINGLPSKRVVNAIGKAKKIVHVGIASARSLIHSSNLFDHLKLSGPSILLGGCLIVDADSRRVLHEKPINKKDFTKICSILKKLNLTFFVNERNKEVLFSPHYKANRPLDIYIPKLNASIVSNIEKEFLHLKTVIASKATDWDPSMFALGISNAKATKKHAIIEVARLLNIKTEEIIGVGDGHNDISLLATCGLKVAMGNAVPKVKEIADYIAPSVDDDGLAHVIERFILKNTSEQLTQTKVRL